MDDEFFSLFHAELHSHFLNVPFRPQFHLGELVVRDPPHWPARIPVHERSRGNPGALGHECSRVDDGTRADRCAVEHGAPDRHARHGLQLAAMDDATMRDGHVVADNDLEVVGRVDDRAFLNVRTVAYRYFRIVAPDDHPWPER